MSLYLKSYEVCKYGTTCPHNNRANSPSSFCRGAQANRPTEFVCDLVSDKGIFSESGYRSSYDLTGKMKIINE